MSLYTIKGFYDQKKPDREAALEAYRVTIAENQGEDALNALAVLAADYAHAEALSLLFEAGVSPALTDKYGFTLLHILARKEESHYHIKPAGAVAASVNLLLDNKVSALRKDEDQKKTCYHYAAQKGQAELVEALAAHGVKLDMTDRKGNTGIHIACEYVKHALTDMGFEKKYLEQSREKDAKEAEEAQKKYDAAVQLVEDYFRVVKTFTSSGVDVDEKNQYGIPALDIAIKSGAKKIAAFLSGTLKEGDSEEAIAGGGMTLQQAAEKNDVDAIKAIVSAGADVNGLKDDKEHRFGGCTALAVAVAHLHGDAVETLLASGADPSYKDGKGRAAISFLFSPDYRGGFNSKIAEEKRIPKIIKAMLGAGFKIDAAIDDDGNTLLILACRSARGGASNGRSLKSEVVNEVLKHNPDFNLSNRFGETALMHCCARDFETMENVQLALLEGGAGTSAADKNGDTALHYAARNNDKAGAKTLCDMLLEFGADAKVVNNKGKTALDLATEADNEPLVKLLLAKI